VAPRLVVIVREVGPGLLVDAPPGQVVVALLCEVRDDRGEEAAEDVHGRPECAACTGPAALLRIQPALRDLDVVIGERVPGKLPDLPERPVELVLLHGVGDLSDGIGEPDEEPPVGKLRHRCLRISLPLQVPHDEPEDVPEFCLETGRGDDIVPVEHDIRAGRRAPGPPLPQRVCPVGADDLLGGDDVVPALAHLEPVFPEHHAVYEDLVPGMAADECFCPEDRVERPRPYDIVALGAELCREERGSAVPSVPPGDVEHRYRRVHPGVEHIFFAGELRPAAPRAGGFRRIDGRVYREILAGREDHLAAGVTEPDRDRCCEDPLPGYAPVPLHRLRPVLKPREHMLRRPRYLPGGVHDIVPVDLHEPLALGEDLDRGLAPPAGPHPLLEFFLPFQDPCLLHIPEDCFPAGSRRHPHVRTRDRGHGALSVDGLAEFQVVLLPPVDVRLVPERADHHRAAAELRVDRDILDDRHLVPEDGDRKPLPLHTAVAFVVRVDRHRNTGCEEFGPGGGDLDAVEVEVVERGRAGDVVDLGKRDGGLAPGAEVHRMLALVDVAGFEHLQERRLGLFVVLREHGDVLVAPVDGEPEPAHGRPHLLDVPDREVAAHLAELLSRYVVFGYPVGLLDLHLGWETVAVPPLGEHYVEPAHTLIACDKVDVAPVQGIADMEVAGRVRRRSVDDEPGFC